MTPHPALMDAIVQPENAADAGVRVRLGEPVEVLLAPEGDERWGSVSTRSMPSHTP